MRRRQLLGSAAGLAGLGGVTGVTAAQSNDNDTPTAAGTESGPTYAAQLSPTVRLISAEITDTGTETTENDEEQRTAAIRLKLEADTPSLVSTSDVFGAVASAGDNGIVQTEQTERTIPSGTSTVTVTVGGFKGVVGVGIGVPNGTPTIVRRSLPSEEDSDPWEPTGSAAGWAGGVSVTTAMGILAAYRVKNNDPDEPEPVE